MNKIVRKSSAAAALVAASACAQSTPPPVSPVAMVDTVVLRDTVRVETESGVNAELEDQVARLQIQLLERDVVLQELRRQLDATRQEVVRNMAKLQGQASRAEAASGMAEAEIALETLSRSGGADLPEYAQAESRLDESTREFDSSNFEGALYLATEARSLARSARSRLGSEGAASLREGEMLFAIPVPLQTVSRSNVRAGPDLSHSVVFTLDGGVSLEGQSHTNQWVRIVDTEGREGWIFHTLVTGRGF